MKFFSFSWKEILADLKRLANDDVALEKIVEKEMKKAIKDIYPIDYKKIARADKEKLEEIKLKVKERYKKEIQQKINELFP